ncbi:MAG TPA: phosphatidylglycerophosphatase A [Acidimicrobiia bacterium]|jgi:phosphatidylglycerophosphatase A
MPVTPGSPLRRVIASGLGAGLVPRRLWGSDAGAGTVGAAVAAGVALVLWPLPVAVHLAATAGAVTLSLWAPRPFLATDQDPQWVAIDEVAGALLALTGLRGLPWIVAWFAFRAADIWKRLPGVAAAERLPGSLGVTADDLVAGVYALGAGWLLTWLT